MKSLRQLSTVSWILLAGVTVSAPLAQGQNEKSAPSDLRIRTTTCPTLSVTCPTWNLGETFTFSATITGLDPGTIPTYKWTAYGGTIVEGQGTSTIKLNTKGLGGQSSTAIVTVGGLNPTCSSTASCSLIPGLPPAPSTKFDSYGLLPRTKENERLDNFGAMLSNQPGAMGYIFSYGTRRGVAGAARAAGERAKAYLVNERDIHVDRIVTVEGGFKEKLTVELWVVPMGAVLPRPEPILDPSKPIESPAPKRAKHPKGH